MDVRGQIFRRIEQSQKSLSAHTRGRFARPIPWTDLSFQARLYKAPDRLIDLRVSDYQEPPALHIRPSRTRHRTLRNAKGPTSQNGTKRKWM
jgi:hypothetical protein